MLQSPGWEHSLSIRACPCLAPPWLGMDYMPQAPNAEPHPLRCAALNVWKPHGFELVGWPAGCAPQVPDVELGEAAKAAAAAAAAAAPTVQKPGEEEQRHGGERGGGPFEAREGPAGQMKLHAQGAACFVRV